MSKKIFIHAENNHNILSSNEVRLYNSPKPEELKVIIWGKELCSGAEWSDFLRCVEDKTKEIDQLKQQLDEKDKQIDIISRDNNLYKYNIDEQKRIIDDFTKQLQEKDKEIERLKNLFELNNEVVINQGKEIFDLRVQVLQQKQNQTQLAIKELEKVKELLLDEYKKYPIVYDKTNDIVAGALDRDKVNEIIDQKIKELRGEK